MRKYTLYNAQVINDVKNVYLTFPIKKEYKGSKVYAESLSAYAKSVTTFTSRPVT